MQRIISEDSPVTLSVCVQLTAVTVRTSPSATALPNPPRPRAAATWSPAGRPPQATGTRSTASRSIPTAETSTAGPSGRSRCVSDGSGRIHALFDKHWMSDVDSLSFAPVHPADLEKMSSLERIAFLQEKLQDIRNHYLLLKSEVASIDRRRKRMKKKERESKCFSGHVWICGNSVILILFIYFNSIY